MKIIERKKIILAHKGSYYRILKGVCITCEFFKSPSNCNYNICAYNKNGCTRDIGYHKIFKGTKL